MDESFGRADSSRILFQFFFLPFFFKKKKKRCYYPPNVPPDWADYARRAEQKGKNNKTLDGSGARMRVMRYIVLFFIIEQVKKERRSFAKWRPSLNKNFFLKQRKQKKLKNSSNVKNALDFTRLVGAHFVPC